jgi:hypothetical protein
MILLSSNLFQTGPTFLAGSFKKIFAGHEKQDR